ncbi:hypothetical protein [Pseudoalteromonas byunsanensis]|uniref:Uncharacterized protein n=1 Tax=Pseudoalteromonas byunsanensis TaxID=327939 RepID=A0A1S1N9M9_9GAMM|nr:hypothetical protein [Pseudoalteromonas byunsanensis]OHU95405.1 hypothetical protein BIW53_11890 [Pseudoalteromonas byunsanensis]
MKKLLTIICILSLFSCTNTPQPPVGILSSEGFAAFTTPRSFDNPGTVYRINENGKRFKVTEIQVPIENGMEELPKLSSLQTMSLGQLLQSIGASSDKLSASIKLNLSRTKSILLEANTGKRFTTRDDDVDNAFIAWAATAKPKDNSRYFIIRETVATKQLNYKVQSDWLNELKLDTDALELAGYEGNASVNGQDILEMNREFSDYRNVWYKAEEVTLNKVLGAGPSQYEVNRTPVSSIPET